MPTEFIEYCIKVFLDAQADILNRPRISSQPATLPSLPSPLTEDERRLCYSHLPSRPILIARSSTNPLFVGTVEWGSAFQIKEMRPVGDHPLRDTWEDNLAFKIHCILDSSNVQWTSTDVVRIGQSTGAAFDPPVVLWIGIKPATLNGHDGMAVALKCLKVLQDHNIDDVDVEIRESVVVPLASIGPKLLKPTGSLTYKKEVNARGPLTSALGFPICAMESPWAEGTGGFFVSEGKQKKRLLLVTARHAVSPPGHQNDNHNAHIDLRSGSRHWANFKVAVLSPQAFDKLLDNIQCEIGRKARLASEREEWLRDVEEQADSEKKNSHREDYTQEREKALQIVGDLSTLHNNILPEWLTMRNRIIGRCVISPPIQHGSGTTTEGYTEDWAAIEVDPHKIDAENFVGNVIDLNRDVDVMDLIQKMPPSFEYPFEEGFLRLDGLVSEEELRAEPTELDKRVNEPLGLTVIKRGGGTGLTVGRANNVCSYVRTTYSGSIDRPSSPSTTQVSKEWPVLPFNFDSGGFAGRGDSGAAVVDGQGRFVGMITSGAGHAPNKEMDLVYMTPMAFLLKRMAENGLMNLNLDPKLDSSPAGNVDTGTLGFADKS